MTSCMWCDHDVQSEWQIGLLIYADRASDPAGLYPAKSRTGLLVCDECKHNIGDDYLKILSDESFKVIGRAFNAVGKATPDFTRTHVTFHHLPEDYQAL